MYKYIILLITIVILLTLCVFSIMYYLTKKHKNFEKRQLGYDYYYGTIINIFFTLLIYTCIILYKYNYSDVTIKFPNVFIILMYLLVVDLFYYWSHRTIHRVPFLKETLHLKHHNAVDLVSNDIFYVDIKEHILYIMFIGIIAQLFININITDYIIVNIILVYHAIYTHSEKEEDFILPLFINSKYHKYHHQIGGGNYSILFPIWDDYMKTRIKTPKKINKQKIKKENQINKKNKKKQENRL